MKKLATSRVLVVGMGLSGIAAARLLKRRGAKVLLVDSAESQSLKESADRLSQEGIEARLAVQRLDDQRFDLVVVSPGVSPELEHLQEFREAGVPVISELELGYQQSSCLNVSITGTNGKTTTTHLVQAVLNGAGRKTIAAGNIGLPLCEIVGKTKKLDWLTLEVSSFQLEGIQYFRPTIAVLLNITPDHLDRYACMDDYVRAKGRIFENQQAFDWAVIQSEALARLRSLSVGIPSKIITFSANSRRADVYLDRGLLISKIDGWTGPLLNLDRTQLRGPHNAENLMAALIVGRIMRIPLEQMVSAVSAFEPEPHRCEELEVVNGVRFINDSKATNLEATRQAIRSIEARPGGAPNIWLIAGGKDKGLEYYDIGPELSQRVKGAYLIGECRDRIRAAWGLFTPCYPVDSLIQAVSDAAECASPGEVVLLSPACSSFDMFQSYQHRGDVFKQAVKKWARSQLEDSQQGPTDSGRRPSGSNDGRSLNSIL